MEGRNRWGRLFAEFLVIILGVLIALAVDRSVQGIDDGALERAYLEALLDEFDQGAENTQFAADFIRSRTGMIETVIQAIETGSLPDSITAPELARSIELSGWHPGVSFPRATWEDLISTGRLALITNTELRRSLVDFYLEHDFVRDLDRNWQAWMDPVQRESGHFLTPGQRLAVSRSTFGGTAQIEGLPTRAVLIAQLRERPETYRNMGQALLVAELSGTSIQGTARSALAITDMLRSELQR